MRPRLLTPPDLHPSEEVVLLLADEPPCASCGDWHDLKPAAAASCRRAQVVALAALETCRQVSERARTIRRARGRAAR